MVKEGINNGYTGLVIGVGCGVGVRVNGVGCGVGVRVKVRVGDWDWVWCRSEKGRGGDRVTGKPCRHSPLYTWRRRPSRSLMSEVSDVSGK